VDSVLDHNLTTVLVNHRLIYFVLWETINVAILCLD